MTKYILSNIPSGKRGIRATLKLMSKVTRQYKGNPVVRELALDIVKNVPEKKWSMEVAALLKWVQHNIRYVKDIRGIETVHTPVELLRIGQGDCDDQSVLLASFLESLGHPTRFIAVGFTPGSLTHVLVQSKIGNKWVSLDPIMPKWPMGKGPKGVKNTMVQHN